MKTYIILALLPFIVGWDWVTHPDIAEAVYYQMPYELKFKLDPGLIREGSIMPDSVFHDNRLHHYPPSYNLTLFWLNKSVNYLKINDSDNASLAFGIASHYITDSYAAPHYISKEDPKLHSLYEKQARLNNTKLKCSETNVSIKNLLYVGSFEADTWLSWIASKDSKIPISASLKSADALSIISRKAFHYECYEKDAIFSKSSFHLSAKSLIIGGIILLLIIIIFLV